MFEIFQLENASASEITISRIDFYSYLTVARREGIKNMGRIDIFTLKYGLNRQYVTIYGGWKILRATPNYIPMDVLMT